MTLEPVEYEKIGMWLKKPIQWRLGKNKRKRSKRSIAKHKPNRKQHRTKEWKPMAEYESRILD